MTLAFIMDGGLFDAPGMGLDLYERFPPVREVFGRAAGWAGLEPGRLLRWELPRLHEHRQVGAIRQAAVTLGLCDVLAERGLRPDVTAGVSLGGMISACVAGAISREDLFRVLGHMRSAPGPSGPAQGAAALVLAPGAAASDYLGEGVEDVHVAVDSGRADNGVHTLVLSGYSAALEKLAAALPDGVLHLLPEFTLAFHSPISGYMAEYLAPFLAEIPFRDPGLPLGSGMRPGLLTTGDEVRDMFQRNQSTMVSWPYLFESLIEQDTELAVLVGPGTVDRFPGSLPFPVLQIETPEQIAEGAATIYELGIGVSSGV